MKCLDDENPDPDQARRLLSDPESQWSYADLNTPDAKGLLPVTYAILLTDSELVRLFYERGTSMLSRNEDGVHPYSVIVTNLKDLQELRQKKQQTQQQQQQYRELMVMKEYVGKQWIPILHYLHRR